MRLGVRGSQPTMHGAVLPAFVGVLAYSAFAQGGYYVRQGVAVAVVLVLLAVFSRAVVRPVAPAVAAFAILACALGVSAVAAGWPPAVWRPLSTLVAAAAAFLVARAIVRAREGERLLHAIAWFATGIAVLGLGGLALHWFPWAMQAQGLWRTSSTLTYSNAAAALLTLALPAPLLLAARRGISVHRLQVFVISTAAITTLSRGGAAGALALFAVLGLCGGRELLRALVRSGLGACAASVGFLPTIASAAPRPFFAVAGLAAGAVVAAAPVRLSALSKRALAAGVAVAVVALAVPALGASGNAAQFVSSRLSPRSDDRTLFWRSSIEGALQHPVLGTGPGTYEGLIHDGTRSLVVTYVHNEYLQALSETGLVGLGSILVAVAVFGLWAWRRRPPRASPQRVVWAAAVAAGTAFCVHGFFDFMWRVPAVVLLAFVWLAFAVDSSGVDSGERNNA